MENPISPLKMFIFPREFPFWTEEIQSHTDKQSMSFQTSFKQILQEKMSSTSAPHNYEDTSSFTSDPAHLAFLMGAINKISCLPPRRHYPHPKVRPQRKSHNLSDQQLFSFQFFKSWVQDLSEGFTATELKKAYRQAALAIHPDHGGDAQLFIELNHHYGTLITVLKR